MQSTAWHNNPATDPLLHKHTFETNNPYLVRKQCLSVLRRHGYVFRQKATSAVISSPGPDASGGRNLLKSLSRPCRHSIFPIAFESRRAGTPLNACQAGIHFPGCRPYLSRGKIRVRMFVSCSTAWSTSAEMGSPNCVCRGWMPIRHTSRQMLCRIISTNNRGDSV